MKVNKMKKKNKSNRTHGMMSIISFIIMLLLLSTVSQSTLFQQSETVSVPVVSAAADDSTFLWEDTFDTSQRIDATNSTHYIVHDGVVSMQETYPQWSDPSWTRMKIITIESTSAVDNAILNLTIDYDEDMQQDYDDIRFKYNSDNFWLPYWIEETNPDPNHPSASVWIKIAHLSAGTNQVYLFYGNPQATAQDNYWDVFDKDSWQKTYVHDQRITYHMASEGAWAPDVCFGEDRYLVTWTEGIPQYLPLGMIYRMQIRGCFYNSDGEQIGNRFDITPWISDPLATFRNEDPSLAYGRSGGDTHFFVAYEYYADPTDRTSSEIHGAIVPRSATQLNDVTRFTICDAAGVQGDPRVAFDTQNKQFFVVWEDGREGANNYNIYGQLYDMEGNRVGTEQIISSKPHTQCQPWITFDPVNHHYLIVWEEGVTAANGPFEIWAQLFDTNGNPLGTDQLISDPATDTTDYNYPSVTYSPSTQQFLVVWQEDDISSGKSRGPIWGVLLDHTADPIISPKKIAQGNFQRPKAIPYMSSSFFIAYDGTGEIWGSLITSTGYVFGYQLQLSDTESSPADWAAVATNGDRIFVTWEDLRLIYMDPYESLNLPDIYCNLWSFNMPTESTITYDIGDEHSIILFATVISKPIAPENLEQWDQFSVEKTGFISFDILDGNTFDVLLSDVSSGASLTGLTAASLRLQARFHRDNPSSSPLLDRWSVSYRGEDLSAPETTLQNIEGTKGLNDWYTSESVILWLHAEDYPIDTGSGVESVYYTLNDDTIQKYNQQSGIILSTTAATDWKGSWDVVFWAEDYSGNRENKNDDENQVSIFIDADRPYVEISTPVDEEQVSVPFWVKATATDNVGVERVEFDIEPFGEREGLPYVDRDPPYEWYCDIENQDSSTFFSSPTFGTNKMVRARVFDESGQSWTQQVWVYITNWDTGKEFQNTLCLVYATGSGSVDTNGITIGGITLGSVSWDFSEGSTVATAGLTGIHSKSGLHQGTAHMFLGFTSDSVVAGIAGIVTVTEP